MTALTRVLSENPAPLQDFSARHDLSREDVTFLTRLAKWKDFYPVAERKQACDAALRLYIDFISPRDADFPLNLSSAQLMSLEDMFEIQTRAARVVELPRPCSRGFSQGRPRRYETAH